MFPSLCPIPVEEYPGRLIVFDSVDGAGSFPRTLMIELLSAILVVKFGFMFLSVTGRI